MIKKIKEDFKKTVLKISNTLGTQPAELSRDMYLRHSVDMNLPRLNKNKLNELGGYEFLMQTIFKESKKIVDMKKTREKTAKVLADYITKNGMLPADFRRDGKIRIGEINAFKDREDIIEFTKSLYPKVFEKLLNDDTFNATYKANVRKNIKAYKRFIITTAISRKYSDKNAVESLRTYAKKNNALLLALPCHDIGSKTTDKQFEIDPELSDFNFVSEDIYLNSKLFISSIEVSAKQINPLTGLDRIAQKNGSMILAAPKQFLHYVANSNTSFPRALMTTGTVSQSNYNKDLLMSKRTSYIAENDHKKGAIIVEIVDNKIFHFRQIQFDDKGGFYDINKYYLKDSVSKINSRDTKLVFGDTHVGSHCLGVNKCLEQIAKETNAGEIIVHDIFDNRFNNHHDVHKPVTRAMLAKKGLTSLVGEGEITANWLDSWAKKVDKITIVKSNHDEALERYIDEGRWKIDAENLYDAIDLVKARMDGKDPLKFLLETKTTLKNGDKINWLDRDEDYLLFGIEHGAHGDKGANGSRGSLASIEKAYHKATVGHSHTAGILREVFQVGTSTFLKLSYNTGPSSWTNTMCITYPNGQRSLINILKVNNKFVWRLA